jgi:hypothetical protein
MVDTSRVRLRRGPTSNELRPPMAARLHAERRARSKAQEPIKSASLLGFLILKPTVSPRLDILSSNDQTSPSCRGRISYPADVMPGHAANVTLFEIFSCVQIARHSVSSPLSRLKLPWTIPCPASLRCPNPHFPTSERRTRMAHQHSRRTRPKRFEMQWLIGGQRLRCAVTPFDAFVRDDVINRDRTLGTVTEN